MIASSRLLEATHLAVFARNRRLESHSKENYGIANGFKKLASGEKAWNGEKNTRLSSNQLCLETGDWGLVVYPELIQAANETRYQPKPPIHDVVDHLDKITVTFPIAK